MAYNKKSSSKEPQKPAFIIEQEIHIGKLEMSDTQAILVSLVQHKGNRYIAVNRAYKTKNNDSYKPKGGIWIPFQEADKIIHLLELACKAGIDRHWNEPLVNPAPVTLKSDSQPEAEEKEDITYGFV